MRKFAWITLLTGLALSGIAGYYSIIGISMIFAGAFWSVVVLTGILEAAKIVSVTWMYRYRSMAGKLLQTYFYGATIVLMCLTSIGIFGYLTRAHVGTEAVVQTAQLTLDEIAQREGAIIAQRNQLSAELASLTTQADTLVSQLGASRRFVGTAGAVKVQQETSARRNAILGEIKQLNAEITTIQKERITTQSETTKATADVGPLRYVALAIYGKDDINTIRHAVIWLTLILMVVFDPLAIMLLIAANVLFVATTAAPPVEPPASHPEPAIVPPPVPTPPIETSLNGGEPSVSPEVISPDHQHVTDIPFPLRDKYAKNEFLTHHAKNILASK